MTDEAIIKELKEGKDDAFKELIRRYEKRIASTIIGMVGRCPEADDIGQETFVRFYRNIQNFRSEAAVGTYLTRIAINLSLNELRSRKRKAMIFLKNDAAEDYIVAADGANPEETDRKHHVYRAIQQLETKFRSVIVLRLIEGYSTQETAEILGVPTGTVLSRLARGQKKLKKLLEPILKEII